MRLKKYLKKALLPKTFIFGVFFIVSCSSENAYNNNYELGGGYQSQAEYLSISDFFTFEPNTTFIMRSTADSPIEIEQEIFTTIISENYFQQRISSMGFQIPAVLRYSDGVLRQIYTSEFYRHEDLTNEPPNMDNVILVEPLALGTTWQTPDGATSEITAVNREVTTPYGTFTDTIEVTRTFADEGYSVVTVFAKGYAMVWERFQTTINGEISYITIELVNVVEGPLETSIFVVTQDEYGELDAEPVTVYINTNQDFAQLFSELLSVEINSIEVSEEEQIIRVDIAEPVELFQPFALTIINFYVIGNLTLTLNGEFLEEIFLEASE
ncbi:MAG: hypothetical protein FWF50_03935 [Defluviitaleaceae bacterium]|nr:hypothetical protein [Defluviitaleaceae bacterium]